MGEVKAEGKGLAWFLKGDKTVIISLWYDSSNITVGQCAVRLSVEQMSFSPGEQTATLSLRYFALLSFVLPETLSFPFLSYLFNILIHSTCNYFKNKCSTDKKNVSSWVTQMTSLLLLEDKVFIRGLVGLLQEVSEFE